ncbi:MAG: thioredoxin family protein [Bacteroidales bacterium]|nr:thioredoxin family protein [Bacteroidales bacterium]
MIKRIFTLLIAMLAALSGLSAQGFNITLKFSHYVPQKVRLTYFYEDKQYVQVDSASQSGSTVTFSGDYQLYPGIYSIILDGAKTSFELLIDSLNQNFTMKCDVNDIQKTAKFTGSDMNARFFEYQRAMTSIVREQQELDTARKYHPADSVRIDKKLSELDSRITDTWKSSVEANKGTFLADVLNCMKAREFGYDKMFDYVNFAQKGLIRTPFFYNIIRAHIAHHLNREAHYTEIIRQTDRIMKMAQANLDVNHYVSGYLLNFYRTFYRLGINEVFVHIADKYFLESGDRDLSSENRQMIKTQRDIYAASIPGSDATPIRMCKTITGDSVDVLSNHSGVLFLLFWANGCGHCDSAENALKYYYDKLLQNNVKVISVNNDKHSISSLKSNTEKKNFPWLDVCDTEGNSRYREYYYVCSTPIMYIIDDKNRILNKVVGEAQITEVAERFSH